MAEGDSDYNLHYLRLCELLAPRGVSSRRYLIYGRMSGELPLLCTAFYETFPSGKYLRRGRLFAILSSLWATGDYYRFYERAVAIITPIMPGRPGCYLRYPIRVDLHYVGAIQAYKVDPSVRSAPIGWESAYIWARLCAFRSGSARYSGLWVLVKSVKYGIACVVLLFEYALSGSALYSASVIGEAAVRNKPERSEIVQMFRFTSIRCFKRMRVPMRVAAYSRRAATVRDSGIAPTLRRRRYRRKGRIVRDGKMKRRYRSAKLANLQRRCASSRQLRPE